MLNHLASNNWATMKVLKPTGFYIAVEGLYTQYKLVIKSIPTKDSDDVHNFFETVPEIFEKFEKSCKTFDQASVLIYWAKNHGLEVDEFVELMEELYNHTLEHNPEKLV